MSQKMTLPLKETDENVELDSTNQKDFYHHLRKYFREYTEITGFHGLRYLIEKRSGLEKIFWVIFLLFSIAGCLYMTWEVLSKYQNGPVVVSFANGDTALYHIPFPAVTICPEVKYSRKKFSYSKVYYDLLNGEKVKADDLKKYYYLKLLCEKVGLQDEDALNPKIIGEGFFKVIDKLKPSAAKMFLFCNFMDKKITFCEKMLTPLLTDKGICYSFNLVGRHEIFRNHVAHYKNYHYVPNNSRQYFDTESGYFKSDGVNTYPRRALTSGADTSFLIFFNYNTNDTDIICNSFWQGFRVSIHNPWDIPRVSKYYFRVSVDKVVLAIVEPDLITTSEEVARYDSEKRRCYMKNERRLMHFQEYSQPNCFIECITNYTLRKCGCVSFFMPRDHNTAICGSGDSECVKRAESDLIIKELEFKLKEKTYCDCKPSCTNLKFNVETSHSDFYFKEFFMKHPYFNIKNDGSHWSILQVYFKNEQFMRKQRNELYGISDLISNLGGLLGLFTGFSLLSLIEIIYFCSLRMLCNRRLFGNWSGPTQ